MATTVEGLHTSGSDPIGEGGEQRNGENERWWKRLKITGDLGAWVAPLTIDPVVMQRERGKMKDLEGFFSSGRLRDEMGRNEELLHEERDYSDEITREDLDRMMSEKKAARASGENPSE